MYDITTGRTRGVSWISLIGQILSLPFEARIMVHKHTGVLNGRLLKQPTYSWHTPKAVATCKIKRLTSTAQPREVNGCRTFCKGFILHVTTVWQCFRFRCAHGRQMIRLVASDKAHIQWTSCGKLMLATSCTVIGYCTKPRSIQWTMSCRGRHFSSCRLNWCIIAQRGNAPQCTKLHITRKPSCRWQTRATLAKSLHGLRNSSGVVSCIARLPIDSVPMVSYYVLYSNCVCKMRRFGDTRLLKLPWPWNPGQGSFKVIETDTNR